MSAESEIEGRALMAFAAGLAAALEAVADHVTASGVPPKLSDALDDVVAALQRDVEALRRGLKTGGKPTDPWTLGLPKILAEVTATLQAFVAVLAVSELTWWTRRLEELKRQHQAERKQEVGR